MTKLKYLKKAKLLMGLDPEVKSYLLPVLALYCLEKDMLSCGEIDLLIEQTKKKLGVE